MATSSELTSAGLYDKMQALCRKDSVSNKRVVFQLQNDKHIKEKLAYVCRQFRLQGDLILYRWIPTGHINTAYYAALYDGKEVRQYLVQKINWFVFREPIPMMHNIDLITKTIMDKEPTLERRRRLHFHHTASGNNYLILREENGEFHNLEDFLIRAVSQETC